MTMFTRSILFTLILSGSLEAKDLRILEITHNSRRLQATVEFLAETTTDVVVKSQPTANKSFDWLDIPEEAKAARIKVGELATMPFDLATSGTTLVELGQPTITQDAKGLPQAVLATTVKTDRILAPVGSAGWVYFGGLESNGLESSGLVAADMRKWNSLYLVLPPKRSLDADNAGTLSVVKSLAEGSRLRVDFPLILRKIDATGKINRSDGDLTIRAGQYVQVKSLKEPDGKGSVYAEVEVLAAPGSE